VKLEYKDSVTFVEVESDGYRGSKSIVEQEAVPVIFLQTTGFVSSRFQEAVDADAICFPDPTDEFIINNNNRLEGMYILAPLFDVDNDDGWYKVTKVEVSRDHLLGNKIDNIQCLLKKSHKIAGVS
jgi:hypothetical protein